MKFDSKTFNYLSAVGEKLVLSNGKEVFCIRPSKNKEEVIVWNGSFNVSIPKVNIVDHIPRVPDLMKCNKCKKTKEESFFTLTLRHGYNKTCQECEEKR